jgi:hypothetical protein
MPDEQKGPKQNGSVAQTFFIRQFDADPQSGPAVGQKVVVLVAYDT